MMNGRICLVTGATRGVGAATARALAARGASVLVHGRDEVRSRALAAAITRDTGNGAVRAVPADFARLGEVRRLGAELCVQVPRLDVLINNAAVLAPPGSRSAEGYDLTFAVNHLAPYLLTRMLLPKLRASAPARIIVVASEAHRRARLDFSDLMNTRARGFMTAYERSKLANLLMVRALTSRLAGSGVTVNAVHPGLIASALFRDTPPLVRFVLSSVGRPFMISPERGARGSLELATAPGLATASGGYYRRGRPVAPSPEAQSDEDAERLWRESARLAGLDP